MGLAFGWWKFLNFSNSFYIPSFLFRSPLSVLRIMASNVSNQIDELVERLNGAERRARILNQEVKNIRREILKLKTAIPSGTLAPSSVATRQNSAISSYSSNFAVAGAENKINTVSCDSNDDADGSPETKKTKSSFNEENGYVIVYTDGACENNGRKGAKAGIGVWFGDNHPLNISKPVEGKATNNMAEIQACVQALLLLESQGVNKVQIVTDSEFTINCMTKWIKNWKKNNWKTAAGGPVKNKEELQKLDKIIKCFVDVTWLHVFGHSGIKGNEEADKLARKGALRYTFKK